MSNDNEVTSIGSSDPRPTNNSAVASVFCGCGPRPRKERRWRKKTFHSLWRRKPSNQYFDAEASNESVWENVDNESQYYFDADEEEALKEDEYPIVFTTKLQNPKPIVSLEAPETLLRTSKYIKRRIRTSHSIAPTNDEKLALMEA